MLDNNKINDYETFIGWLKKLKDSGAITTVQILEILYLYYKDNVTYNYDLLQYVKLTDTDKSSPSSECNKVFNDIECKVDEFNYEMRKKGCHLTKEMIDNAIKEGKIFSREEATKKLDEVFRKVEGRALTERNKEKYLSHYYDIIHHPYRAAQPNSILFKNEELEHSTMKGIALSGYDPVYKNGMLIDGVCAHYVMFEEKICKDLGIKHKTIRGIGTTGHTWSMIYLPEENKWVHFDMTMARFYLGNWIKNHDPYKPENWICASTEEIFEMQPSRIIKEVGGKHCNIDKNNPEKLMEFINEEVQR